MQDCWSFTCCFSWTLGSSSKCGQLKSFYRYYFGRCSSELAQLVPLPFSRGRSTRYSDRLHDFSVIIPRCYKDVNSFFPLTARLYNSLPIECFSLTYNLNGFKSVNILSRLNFNKFTFVKIIFVMNNGCYNMIQQQALSSGKPWKIKIFMLHF